MLITLITSDFKDSNYFDICGCPLYRALKRLGYNIYTVGGSDISDTNVKSSGFIDGLKWNGVIASDLISKANSGKEVSYQIEIKNFTLIKT